MYERFYSLNEIPFSLAPDPKYLFRTESLMEVLANLRYGIENGKGLVVVTGEVGTGKTTILRSMLQSLDRSVLAAYVFNPILTTQEFFSLLAGEFRLRAQQTKADMLRSLGQLLLSRSRNGLRTALVIDEAHLLPAHLTEEIRLLSNFETNREKLLQIILCGQPELHQLLVKPELRQLKQRISLKCSVKPLTRTETTNYIRWRLKLAGSKDSSLFQTDAIELVHRLSGGIARIINNICDNALLTGFGDGSKTITAAIIREVADVLDLDPLEATGPLTAAESLIDRDSVFDRRPGSEARSVNAAEENNKNGSAAPQDNLRYLRPIAPPPATNGFITKPPPGNGSSVPLILQVEDDAELNSELRFFSRVRVTRQRQ